MDYQVLFNIALGISTVVVGWYMKGQAESIRNLRDRSDKHVDDLTDLAVSIPQNYVHKSDMRQIFESITRTLERIEEKIDKKADK